MDRQKILFLLPNLGGGGAEKAMVVLLRHLDRSRFEPHLGLVEAAGPYLKEVPSDIAVYDLKARRVRHAFVRMIRLVRKLRPRTVLSVMPELNIATVLGRPFFPPSTRVLIREGTSASKRNLQNLDNLKFRPLLYRLYGRADIVICVADFVADDLAENYGVPRKKMVRIWNPVNVGETRSLANAIENPYSGSGPHLVAAGRLSREKGLDILIEAMPMVRSSLPGAQLTILGEGELRSELQAQRDGLGLGDAVRLIGFQPQPFPYLKHADVFVLPSRFEGVPNALLEALALGTPVVASDCPGGVREILAGCPIGWLAPPEGPKALAETIVSVSKLNVRNSQSAARLDGYLNRFEAKSVARAYEELF